MANDIKLDQTISQWLEHEAPYRVSERVLEATFERTRRSRQQARWRALLARLSIQGLAPALGSALVLVLVVGLAVSFYLNLQSRIRPAQPTLPSSIGDWTRVSIDSRFPAAQLDTFAAGPTGLVALVGELGSHAFQLVVSANGSDWSVVPDAQIPLLEGHHVGLAGTDPGFLMLVDNDVWTSANGLSWDGLAGSVTDPELSQGDVVALAAAGPGLVAVGGNNKAWHSTTGSDWSLAEVPPPPAELERPGLVGAYVQMRGVAVAGSKLVAWGFADAYNGEETIGVPVLWYSDDGLSWANALEPQMGYVMAVAGGSNGFVVIGANFLENGDAEYAAWFSADGQTWQKGDVFTSLNDEGMPVTVSVKSVAATGAGYVAVGANNQCLIGSCASMDAATPPMEAVIWTSADGLSWSRLASNDLFIVGEPSDPQRTPGSDATSVAAWGAQFVVGGHYDGRPVIWISGPEASASGAGVSAAPATIPTPTLGPPADFAGTWEATDPLPDSSHLTMELTALPGGSYQMTVRDDYASVCSGRSSTMTGIAEPRDPDAIVIAQPDYRCDDGSEPHELSGPPLDEQLQYLGFTYDPGHDELRDSFGLPWTRVEVAR